MHWAVEEVLESSLLFTVFDSEIAQLVPEINCGSYEWTLGVRHSPEVTLVAIVYGVVWVFPVD